MKKLFTRWYEKNEYLKAFMGLLEDTPIESQCEIAADIILQASSMIDRDYTKIVEEIADYNPKNYKRWYDKNPNIHIAIESLRDLTDEQREIIIQNNAKKILDSNAISFEGLIN